MRGTSLRVLSNLAANAGMRTSIRLRSRLLARRAEGETVYCFAPPGVERKGADGLNQICRILKPVYGI
jgi:hypothetical protein